MLKSLRRLFRRRLDRFLERRLAGFNPASKTLAKHAYRTEFHCSRKLVAAARAGALGLRFHGPKRPSAGNLSQKQHHASTEWFEIVQRWRAGSGSQIRD